MAVCSRCGNPLREGEVICSKCGNVVFNTIEDLKKEEKEEEKRKQEVQDTRKAVMIIKAIIFACFVAMELIAFSGKTNYVLLASLFIVVIMLVTYMVLQYPENRERKKLLLAIPSNALTDIIIFCILSALFIFFILVIYNGLKVRGTISSIEALLGLLR